MVMENWGAEIQCVVFQKEKDFKRKINRINLELLCKLNQSGARWLPAILGGRSGLLQAGLNLAFARFTRNNLFLAPTMALFLLNQAFHIKFQG